MQWGIFSPFFSFLWWMPVFLCSIIIIVMKAMNNISVSFSFNKKMRKKKLKSTNLNAIHCCLGFTSFYMLPKKDNLCFSMVRYSRHLCIKGCWLSRCRTKFIENEETNYVVTNNNRMKFIPKSKIKFHWFKMKFLFVWAHSEKSFCIPYSVPMVFIFF